VDLLHPVSDQAPADPFSWRQSGVISSDDWADVPSAFRAGSTLPPPWAALFGPLQAGTTDELMVMGQIGQSIDGRGIDLVNQPQTFEINVGANRCGVDPGAPALALAQRVAARPGLRFAGLQAYQGRAQHIQDLTKRQEVTEAAIARVLDAEHAARDAVRDAEQAAVAMTEAARAAARALAERTERRIGGVRARFEQKTVAGVAALDAAAAEADTPHDLTPEELARLDAAIAVLAARLTEARRQ